MWLILVMIIILLFLTIYGLVPTLLYRVLNRNFRNTRTNQNIYLTFDDGVDEKYTKEVLRVLKENNIPATFFVVANFAEKHPALISNIKSDGHIIGLHSLSHKNEILQTPWNIKKDFSKSMDVLKKLGVKPKFFRPPWGHFSLSGIKEFKSLDLTPVLWNVIVGDWKANITSEEIANRLLEKTEMGDIICLHDGRGKNEAPKRTVEALEIVIPIWRSRGFTFGTLEELYEY